MAIGAGIAVLITVIVVIIILLLLTFAFKVLHWGKVTPITPAQIQAALLAGITVEKTDSAGRAYRTVIRAAPSTVDSVGIALQLVSSATQQVGDGTPTPIADIGGDTMNFTLQPITKASTAVGATYIITHTSTPVRTVTVRPTMATETSPPLPIVAVVSRS